ncbi:MAG: ABC transporter ATP-binding protein [Halobacteriota archaeon]
MTDQPVLSVEGVTAGYGETTVLREIDLTVEPGEIVSIVGRNGAGKTTTLRTINGILTPTSGVVRHRGEDISALDPAATARKGISLVPEQRQIFPDLTVRENFQVAAHGGAPAADSLTVEQAIARFENLGERLDNAGSSLSGGEQQMLAIARALVAGADLLLLDEPTEGLAPKIVEDVVNIVRELNESEITILLVEQNVTVCLELADRLYIIDQGRMVWEGTPDELRLREDLLDRYLGVSV